MESPEQDQRRLSRRAFLAVGGSLILGLAAYGGRELFDKASARYFPPTPESQNLEPSFALLGAIAVYRGANIRTSPEIPDRTRFRKPDNTIDWEEIEVINGVALNGAEVFVIADPLAVEGQFVGHFFDRNVPSYWLDGRLWIKVNVKRENQEKAPFYISFSSMTHEFVKPLKYLDINSIYYHPNYRSLIYISGQLKEESEFGQIFVPKNPETVAREIMPDLWAKRIRLKLDGKAFLSQGERIVENVEVVAFGNTWDEFVSMKEAGTPVNVRDHPGTYYVDAERPIYYLNGELIRILGEIHQGTIIKKVLLSGWGAFRFGDVEGKIFDASGQEVTLPPDKICAIWSGYLA